MASSPRHKTFGTPIEEWISLVPNELGEDAIGLWQIVPCFRYDFGLEGQDLENYVRQCIGLLLARGAIPVYGTENNDGWRIWTGLSYGSSSTLDQVMNYWQTLGRDPDFGDLWFALPKTLH
jgi:hypothetical protein